MTLVASRVFTLNMAHDPRSRAIDATSIDPWGPSRSLMEDLRADLSSRHGSDVLHVLHDALLAAGPQWRRAHKALMTIVYCLREGSNEIAIFALAHGNLISQLAHFEFFDAYGLDRGAPVREEARAVAEMLQLSVSQSGAGPSIQATHRTRQEPPPIPPRHPAQMNYFASLNRATLQPQIGETYSETERLSILIRRVESSDDEDTWLDIYKLLFLVRSALPTTSSADIRNWSQHIHLLTRLSRWRVHSDTVAGDVRRLATELADLFSSGLRASEVRRRIRMF